MNEIQFHEHLKQCAIYSYGKNNYLPSGYKRTDRKHNITTGFQASVIRNGKDIIIAYDGTKVKGYTRECYIHGPRAIKSYFGKSFDEFTKEEINEFWEDNI